MDAWEKFAEKLDVKEDRDRPIAPRRPAGPALRTINRTLAAAALESADSAIAASKRAATPPTLTTHSSRARVPTAQPKAAAKRGALSCGSGAGASRSPAASESLGRAAGSATVVASALQLAHSQAQIVWGEAVATSFAALASAAATNNDAAVSLAASAASHLTADGITEDAALHEGAAAPSVDRGTHRDSAPGASAGAAAAPHLARLAQLQEAIALLEAAYAKALHAEASAGAARRRRTRGAAAPANAPASGGTMHHLSAPTSDSTESAAQRAELSAPAGPVAVTPLADACQSARSAAPRLLAAVAAASSAAWTRLEMCTDRSASRGTDDVLSGPLHLVDEGVRSGSIASLQAQLLLWDEWLARHQSHPAVDVRPAESDAAVLAVAASCAPTLGAKSSSSSLVCGSNFADIGTSPDSSVVVACCLAARLLLALRCCNDTVISADASSVSSLTASAGVDHVQTVWAVLEAPLHARRDDCKAAMRNVADAVAAAEKAAAGAEASGMLETGATEPLPVYSAAASRGKGGGRGRGGASRLTTASSAFGAAGCAPAPAPVVLMLRPRPETQALQKQLQQAASDAASAAAAAISAYASCTRQVQGALATMLAAALGCCPIGADNLLVTSTDGGPDGSGREPSVVTALQHFAGACLLHLAEATGFAREASSAARQLKALADRGYLKSPSGVLGEIDEAASAADRIADSTGPRVDVLLAAWAVLSPASPRPLVLLGTWLLTRTQDVFAACCAYVRALGRLDRFDKKIEPEPHAAASSSSAESTAASTSQLPEFARSSRRVILANLAAVEKRGIELSQRHGRAPAPRVRIDTRAASTLSHTVPAAGAESVGGDHCCTATLWKRVDSIASRSSLHCGVFSAPQLPFFRYLGVAAASAINARSAAAASGAGGDAAAAALEELPLVLRRWKRLHAAAHPAKDSPASAVATASVRDDGAPVSGSTGTAAEAQRAADAAEATELQAEVTAALGLTLQLRLRSIPPSGVDGSTLPLRLLCDSLWRVVLLDAASEVCAATADVLELEGGAASHAPLTDVGATRAATDAAAAATATATIEASATRPLQTPAIAAVTVALLSAEGQLLPLPWLLSPHSSQADERSVAEAFRKLVMYASGSRAQLELKGTPAEAAAASRTVAALDELLMALSRTGDHYDAVPRHDATSKPASLAAAGSLSHLSAEAPPFMLAADWRAAAAALASASHAAIAPSSQSAAAAPAGAVKLLRPCDITASAVAVAASPHPHHVLPGTVGAPDASSHRTIGTGSALLLPPAPRTIAECGALLEQLEQEVASHLKQLSRDFPSAPCAAARSVAASAVSGVGGDGLVSSVPPAPPGLDLGLGHLRTPAAMSIPSRGRGEAARGPPPGLASSSAAAGGPGMPQPEAAIASRVADAAGMLGAASAPGESRADEAPAGGLFGGLLAAGLLGQGSVATSGSPGAALLDDHALTEHFDLHDHHDDAFDGDLIEGVFLAAVGDHDAESDHFVHDHHDAEDDEDFDFEPFEGLSSSAQIRPHAVAAAPAIHGDLHRDHGDGPGDDGIEPFLLHTTALGMLPSSSSSGLAPDAAGSTAAHASTATRASAISDSSADNSGGGSRARGVSASSGMLERLTNARAQLEQLTALWTKA